MSTADYVLEVMWNPSSVINSLDDQFTSLSAWTVEAGSTFTVAANLVSNAAGSGNRMSTGNLALTDISTGSRVRFKWVTGGIFYWMLRYVDTNNYVMFWADGTNFRLYKTISGSQTQVATVAAALTNTNFYWIQPIVSGTQWSATINNDTGPGSVGSLVATITAQTVDDAAVQFGKTAVQMDGGTGMQMGGNFADVYLVKTPEWTAESNWIAQWRRGRDYASQLTGRATAGELTVSIDNPAGRFAPLNTASPLFGYLLPGRKIRIRTTSPSYATCWQGFIDEIRPSPNSRSSNPTATIRASGPLKWIANRRASTAVYTSITTGTAVGYILDDAGWPSGDRRIDAGQITMNRWKADGDSALSHLQELEEMEFGYIGETRDGKIVWEDQQHRLNAPHDTSQATFTDANAGVLSYTDIEELDPWRDVYNIFSADVTLYTVQTLATLWSLTGETPSINPAATKDFWAVYPTPDAASQADHVDAWTTPAATTDYLANTQADGLGTNKTAQIAVAVSKFANSMKISLTNNDAGVVYITLLQARGTAVYKNDPIRIQSEDATSETTFGKRTFPLPGKFYPSTTSAKSYVDAGLARYKDQLAVLSITYKANQSSSHMTQALTRDISERISVVANGTLQSGAQLGIVGDFFIESESHRVDLSGHWVTYELSDSRTVSGYWKLGLSQLGVDTKLAI